jgi:hypothetical protein
MGLLMNVSKLYGTQDAEDADRMSGAGRPLRARGNSAVLSFAALLGALVLAGCGGSSGSHSLTATSISSPSASSGSSSNPTLINDCMAYYRAAVANGDVSSAPSCECEVTYLMSAQYTQSSGNPPFSASDLAARYVADTQPFSSFLAATDFTRTSC